MKIWKFFLSLIVILFTFVQVKNEEFFSLEELEYTYEITNKAEEYDMYVLSVQWPSTFCLQSKTSDTCNNKLNIITNNTFTLHGLWPSHSSGQQMHDCNSGEKIPIADDGSLVFKEMMKVWPSLSGPNEGFWTHEYNCHGYCFMEKYKYTNPNVFFNYTINLFDKHNLANLLKEDIPLLPQEMEYNYSDLIKRVQKNVPTLQFKLECYFHNNKQYLFEVRFLFDLELKPLEIDSFHTNCKNQNTYVIFE